MPRTRNPFTSERAYNIAYRRALKVYRARLYARPMGPDAAPAMRGIDIPWPKPLASIWKGMTGWIKDGTWWIQTSAKCAIAIGSLLVVSNATVKVAAAVKRLNKIAKTDRKARTTRAAIRRLGGIKKTMKVLGAFARSRGKDVSRAQKADLKIIVRDGSGVMASLFGVGSCVAIGKKIF